VSQVYLPVSRHGNSIVISRHVLECDYGAIHLWRCLPFQPAVISGLLLAGLPAVPSTDLPVVPPLIDKCVYLDLMSHAQYIYSLIVIYFTVFDSGLQFMLHIVDSCGMLSLCCSRLTCILAVIILFVLLNVVGCKLSICLLMCAIHESASHESYPVGGAQAHVFHYNIVAMLNEYIDESTYTFGFVDHVKHATADSQYPVNENYVHARILVCELASCIPVDAIRKMLHVHGVKIPA